MSPISGQLLSMTIGVTYAPILVLINSLMNFISHWLISFSFMATGSSMVTTTIKSVSGWTWFLRHVHYCHGPFFGRPYRPPQNLADTSPGTFTSAFPVSSKLTPSTTRWVKSVPLGLSAEAPKSSANYLNGQHPGNLIKLRCIFVFIPVGNRR